MLDLCSGKGCKILQKKQGSNPVMVFLVNFRSRINLQAEKMCCTFNSHRNVCALNVRENHVNSKFCNHLKLVSQPVQVNDVRTESDA